MMATISIGGGVDYVVLMMVMYYFATGQIVIDTVPCHSDPRTDRHYGSSRTLRILPYITDICTSNAICECCLGHPVSCMGIDCICPRGQRRQIHATAH